MMNKKTSYKRIVSLVLAVFMVASLLSVSAVASNTKIYVNGTLVQNGDEFEADSVTVKIDPIESDDVVEVNNQAVALDENGEFVIYTSAPEATDTTDTPDAVVADGEVTIKVIKLNEVTDSVTITVTAASEEEETKDTADTSDESETKDTADESDTDGKETKDTADESDTEGKETNDTADTPDESETKDTADESDTDGKETKDTADESDTDGKETKDTADESDTDGKETKDTADESDTDDQKETKDNPDDTDSETNDQPKTEKYLNGDVDFDTLITSNDALMILRRSVGLEEFDNIQSVVGDVTGNGVYSDDALIVLRASVGLDTINPEYVDVVIG